MNEIVTIIGVVFGVLAMGGVFYYKNKVNSLQIELKNKAESKNDTQILKDQIELKEKLHFKSNQEYEKNKSDMENEINNLLIENQANKNEIEKISFSLMETEQKNKKQLEENSQLRQLGLSQEARILELQNELKNQKESQEESSSKFNKAILVVDDSVVVRNKLKKLLENNSFEVTTANDGLEALDVLKNNSFSLVITDLEMPNLDGLGLISEIGKSDFKDTPVIAITGHEHVEIQLNQCQSLYGIHKKPYDEKLILNKVNQLIKISA